MANKPYEPPSYGARHVMEDEMRDSGAGVYGIKNRGASPSNKAMNAAPADKALSSMTKARLLDTAKTEGVAIETDDNKADLIAKIEKARKG